MLCVIAVLSPEVNKTLSLLREAAMPQAVFSPLHAHITLATYLPEETEPFICECEKMFRGVHPFTVRYEKLEVLSETSIIVATPTKTGELVSLHDCISDEYGQSLDQWTCDDNWYPHTTLIYNPEADLDAVCAEMMTRFVPFETRIETIEFSRVEETGYTLLKTISLL